MRTKRILSIVLTLAMLLGLLPGMILTAYAEGNTTEITPTSPSGPMTITLKIKAAQTITASDVTATYGDTDKSVSASVTTPATGGGAISYAVKKGSENYIGVDASTGALTIKAVPPTDGKAYVIVTAAETDDYAEATKEVAVTISPAEVTVKAEDQSIYVGGTVPDLSSPVLGTHYTVTGLVGEDTLTTAPTLAYQKDGSAATPDNTTAGTYDIVASGAAASDNYTITCANGTLTISERPYVPPTPTRYEVKVTASGEGGTVKGDTRASWGDKATVVATPDEGYDFVGWYDRDGKLVSTEAEYTFTVKGSTTLEARFERKAEPEPEPEPKVTVSMSRLYNPNTGEHLYTSDTKEREHLVTLGWELEGVAWQAPMSGDPVFRLYNPNSGEHHYTMDVAERDALVDLGWTYEGVGWYSDPAKGVAIYREYNPNALAFNHNYTADEAEHDHLVSIGWKDEGIAWYGVAAE